MTTPEQQFAQERRERLDAYAQDASLRQLSRQWLQESMAKKYVYNFDWLGRPIIQYPQDMVAIQELVWRVRPDLIIETGIAHGGSLILSASMLAMLDMCDAIEAGTTIDPRKSKRKVIGLDIDIRAHNRAAIEAHPMASRIQMFQGSSVDPAVVQQVRAAAQGYKKVMVFLDSMHTHAHVLDNPRRWKMEHSYWGPGYTQQQIEQMLREEKAEYKVLPDDEMFKVVARSIADGNIIGWFQGRLEWGARALGHRSILANPCRPDMKDILNLRIKKRESFRPFAPAILLEAVGDYFEQTKPDPFMVKVYKIKPEKRASIPAVTHVDGTGRLQTVTKEEEPKYYGVIKAFGDITGVPILINTSFNENEPIVCTPKQAYDCFKRTRMDMLVLGNCVLSKPPEAAS